MPEFLEEVLKLIAVYSIPFGIVCYLVKILIVHWLDKDISAYRKSLENDATSFKQSLENTANLELEKYKSQLETERVRLQISYGGIFEKQANAILEIYKVLIVLDEAARGYLESVQNRELEVKFFESWKNAQKIISSNCILLPEKLDPDLSKFMREYFIGVHHYISAISQLKQTNPYDASNEERQQLKEMRDKASIMVNEEIPKLKNDLVSYMRKTLGIIQI